MCRNARSLSPMDSFSPFAVFSLLFSDQLSILENVVSFTMSKRQNDSIEIGDNEDEEELEEIM
ncbi:unnamed protein product [Larinioides sclopetarius]|uniref:Uncharacterized protein n=1 Tax=Larinioides sclopetarius TaxID=280406 RepID=A0AAV2A1E7_9ARAC